MKKKLVKKTAAPVVQPVIEKREHTQDALFEKGTNWEQAWQGMPEFVQNDIMPWKTVYVHFEDRAGMEAFSERIGQVVDLKTAYIWYPEATIEKVAHRRYVDAGTKRAIPKEAKNDFRQQAEAQLAVQLQKATISMMQLTDLLNICADIGMTIDAFYAWVKMRYGVMPLKLTHEQHAEAIELLRSGGWCK